MTFFFFNDTATTEIYTLSLHDALPISVGQARQDEVVEVARAAGDLLRAVPLRDRRADDVEGARHARVRTSRAPCAPRRRPSGRARSRRASRTPSRPPRSGP